MSNDGKLYEELIFNKPRSNSRNLDEDYNEIKLYRVLKDINITGCKSLTPRQIDVAIYNKTNYGDALTVVECKHYNKKIDVPILESFINKLDDVRANGGIIFTALGYSKPALKYALSTRGLSLEILTLNDLEEYLYHDYNFFNESCINCEKRSNIFGKSYGHVDYHYFSNVLTDNNKYIKIYTGSCHNCGDTYFLSSKCKTSTYVLSIDDRFKISNNYKISPRVINCNDNCGLQYHIDEYGNVSYIYKEYQAQVIATGYNPF
jgi:hypothetical protein